MLYSFKKRKKNLPIDDNKIRKKPPKILYSMNHNTYVEVVPLSLELGRGIDLIGHDSGDSL